MHRLTSIFTLVFCLTLSLQVHADNQWSTSTLSETTINSIKVNSRKYYQCLDTKITAFKAPGVDPRNAANWVLKQCEAKLKPIGEALIAEKVPIEVTDRFILRKRHQAARKVLQMMMYAEAMKQQQAATK